ncbi:glycosyl hydrolase family 28-related protein [uncultured Bacteroides sp.]|uniref:glycosyl hydrolase family 28-related protein n=5 Tax=uncultured Bacteroides sp. TaxID=162156 RepID=UPI0025924F07|nr:glycosyl hydrolase family 28-related protein [uncultured Bacteroides sp.]
MKKVFNSFILLFIVAAGWAATVNSVSVYTQRPADSEAVYFTSDNYRIKADGSIDVTDELQRALNEVKEKYNFGIVFIPEGKYRISRTIYIPNAVRLIGYGKNRPIVFLAKDSPGYQQEVSTDKGKANYMFWFTGGIVRPGSEPRDAGAGTFYSAISNIDLKIESGNPHAVALRTHFAQHSFVSHVDIHIGEGKAGLFDVGNEMEDVRFFGGDYGIYTTKTSPSWQMMMINTWFEGQRKAAIRTQEGGLTIVRLYVRNVPVVIELNPNRSDKIYMEDCTWEGVKNAGVVVSNEGLSPNQLSMRRIVCKQVPVFIRFRESGKEIAGESNLYKVKDFSYGLHIKDMSATPEFKTEVSMEKLSKKPPVPVNDIPAIPSMTRWVNIRNLGAKGDGESDDTEVFRKAIEEYDVIYVPQGWYIVSQSLKLKKNTALIGLNPVSTQLKLKESTSAFSGFGSPVPLLEAPQGGNNFVSGIGLNTGAYNYRAVGCKWMAGADSYMNDVKFLGVHGTMTKGALTQQQRRNNVPQISTPEEPVCFQGKDKAWDNQHWSLWITNGGGGVFKDIWTASTYATNGIYVNNTATPGRIYAMSVEHHVRNEVRFKNVSNWQVYALQLEEETRESPDCQQIELQNCSNILFANLYLFRVIRVETPFPYAIRTWNCKDIEFYNVHNFTQMRFTTDLVCYDVNTRQDVRPWEFTRLTISGEESRLAPLCAEPGKVEMLATGFEYAEGMARDSKGNVYFSEQRMRRIYKWDVATEQLSLVADFPWQPLSLACDTQDNLLVFFKYYPQPGNMVGGNPETVIELPDAAGTTFSHWGNDGFATRVYSIRPDNPEETIRLLDRVRMNSIPSVTKSLYPAHRWRDLHDFDEISVRKPEYCFVAPDGVTVIPEQYDFARSSSVLEAVPGRPFYVADEYNHRLVRMDVNPDGTLENLTHFLNHGEFGSAIDGQGNVYVAEGHIYVFDKQGNVVKEIRVSERPTSIVVAGNDGNTLFIAARSSLYRYTIHP